MNRKTLPSQSLYSNFAKEVSRFTCKKGSLTVEAALLFPVFLLALMSLLYCIEILSLQNTLHAAAHYAGRRAMIEGVPFGLLSVSRVEQDVKGYISRRGLQKKLLIKGERSIDGGDSYMVPTSGRGEIVIRCQVRPPVPLFHFTTLNLVERVRIKAWVGYVEEFERDRTEEMVYVTDTGMVYHKDRNCTYLDLSIQRVPIKEVPTLRNQGGGKYYACDKCKRKKGSERVYITNMGDKYHKERGCSGLKRTVHTLPLSEAKGLGACSRCGR